MAEIMEIQAYSVSQLNYYLKELLLDDELLASLAVQGEISGYKQHSSGHIYFTLKDDKSAIRCVMFRRYAGNLTFTPDNGMNVVVVGNASLYEKDGTCQLYVQEVFAVGAGQEFAALEHLKKSLKAEGLFEEKNKKPLPFFAQKIGVISSAEGAAWADIQKVAYQHWSSIDLQLYPTLVQGDAAAEQVAKAIMKADSVGYDVLLVARGGGSYEDLSAFNSEIVVRAIAKANTPVVTAIGHEVDFTLADLAADVRAATPSHAAEIAVPDAAKWHEKLQQYEERLQSVCNQLLVQNKDILQGLENGLAEPAKFLQIKNVLLDELGEKLTEVMKNALYCKKRKYEYLLQSLSLLNPVRVLERGYSMCIDEKGHVVTDAKQVEQGDELVVRLAKGQLLCRVEKKELAE